MDLEFVNQPFGATQSEAQSRPGGKSIPHGQFNIRNPRTLIGENQPHADSGAVQGFQLQRAASAVDHGVSREFACRGYQLGLVHQGKTDLAGQLADPPAHRNDVGFGRDGNRIAVNYRHYIALWPSTDSRSASIPASTLRAVRTPWRDMPNSTNVMATAGCIPTTTVCASSTRDMAAIFPSIRPMKESTISRLEISMRTPRAPVSLIRLVKSSCSVMAKRSCMSTWMVTRRKSPMRRMGIFSKVYAPFALAVFPSRLIPVRCRARANASDSVAFVVTSSRLIPRCTMVCAICGRTPLMMQSAPIRRAAVTVFRRCCATSVSTVG